MTCLYLQNIFLSFRNLEHILPKLLFLPSTFVLKENVCSGLPVRLDAAPLTRAAHSYVDTWFPHRLTGCEP